KAIKAQYQNLETYSPSIKKMVEGFAKAYLVRHDKAITDDQAKEQRIKELENYKKLLRDGLPKEFSPESLLQDSTDLHQALVSSTKESNSPTNENLDQIKEMKKLTYKIDKGMEKYKKCLGKLRFRELTSPDPEAPGCELKIPQYRCQGPDHSNCTEIPSKEITFERAQEKIKDYQLKMTSDIKEGINKYTNMAGADNESIEIPEGTFDLLDQKAQSLSLEQNKKTKIEETAKESGKNDKKYLDKHFEKLECSLMLFNDRAKMMSEIYDSGEPSKSMDTKKIFLKGLKNSGCLDQGYDLNHELGLINASKEVFSKNTGYEMNHDFLESCIQKQPDAVKLEGRIRELEDEVMAAKGSIAKIKEKKDYKNLFELKVLSLQRYKIKCIYSRKRHPCHLDFTENSGNNKLDSFISHNNKVIGILEENELKSTPSYAPDLRQHTKRMADACTDKRREKYPKLCLDAKNRHTNAMMKTENEKVRDSHEKYHITYGPDGTKEIRKKAKVSSMVVSSLGRGIVEYGVPTWMQYESNKAQMNYNEAMGYNKKVNNYMMDNGYFWGGGYGGYGYAGGIYPFSTFNNGYYSPFLSSGYQAGGYRSQYLSIQ
ncbi:MAG: hypothetical protein HN576_11320, partial [Bacteriovoracaceae bacterium]|nr:hypothetical protein [Bacteriovoracaceae bacterium]